MGTNPENKSANHKDTKKLGQNLTETIFDTNSKEPLIKLARRAQEYCNKEESRHREALYIMVTAALYVRYGMNQPNNWADLCVDSYWQHRRQRDRPSMGMSEKEKSKFTGIFLFAGPKEIRYDRAWKYSQVVHHYYSLGVFPEDLTTHLKKDGGIDAVVAIVAASSVDPSKAQAKNTDDESDTVCVDDSIDQGKGDDSNEQVPKTAKGKQKRNKLFMLEVALNDANAEDAMIRAPGKEILIHIVQDEGTGKYIPYRALNYSSTTSIKKT